MNLAIITLLIGSALALMFWILFSSVRRIPTENRQFRDRPAFGFRMVWPLIQFADHYWKPLFRESYLNDNLAKLKTAGLEYSLTPMQFIASKCISAVLFGLLVTIVAKFFSSVFFLLAPISLIAGYWYPDLWLKDVRTRRTKNIVKALPFYLDVITLAVEAGSNLTGGITQAVKKTGDSELRKEFHRILRDIRSGRSRAEALRDFSTRVSNPLVTSVVASLIQAEKTGTSLGPILRAQASQLRVRRFQMAEKKAMEAPVKMLAPLVIFIFPTTSLVIGFILLSKAIQEGLITWQPLLWAYTWPG